VPERTPAPETPSVPEYRSGTPGGRRRSRRRWIDRLVIGVAATCAAIACAALASVVVAVLLRGLPAVTWRFLTEQIRQVGADGGVFYNVVGTLILVAAAAVVCLPLSVGIALVQAVYLPPGRRRRFLGVVLYLLNGVPSILLGIFGFMVFVKGLGWGKSWLNGGLLLGVMILPTVTVALVERINVLPRKYLDAAVGLGMTTSQVVRSVILPQTFGGLLTGLLLGLARAAGETAPILFTASINAGATFPTGVKDSPVLALPHHIFMLSQDSFNPQVAEKVWGSAVVLLALVLALSLLALPARLRVHEEARHG
jgi:phosphate transport system permease protein